MKLIKPSEISARILTMLDESDERVIIVSPYVKISKWYKFIKKINELKSRKIATEIYVRDDPENKETYGELDQLRLEYKKIPHLHCKFYMNERCGIVTSMNLLLSSDINSLEIGYATETWTEYSKLLEFYHRYICFGNPVPYVEIAGIPAANPDEVMHALREKLKGSAKNSWLWLAENALHISTGRNNFTVWINEGYVRMTARLRLDSLTNQKSNQNSSLIAKKIGDLTTMKVRTHPGSKPEILKLDGEGQRQLKSTCINVILKTEVAYMIETVMRFIDAMDDLKF